MRLPSKFKVTRTHSDQTLKVALLFRYAKIEEVPRMVLLYARACEQWKD
jgi:hypothetical protein